jgi:hypothetical protein
MKPKIVSLDVSGLNERIKGRGLKVFLGIGRQI